MRALRGSKIVALPAHALLLAVILETTWAQGLPVVIRGRSLTLQHYPAADHHAAAQKLILASGDGGWRGFDDEMAKQMASWGYDVYGLDTRAYLKTFGRDAGLSKAQAAEDFGAVAAAVADGGGNRVVLMGWSAGAALAVLGGTREQNKQLLLGVVAVSLPKEGELGWNWTDRLTFLPFVKWRGPFFSCLEYVPKVAPLPLLIIQSSHDRWVPEQDRKELFEVAVRPRRRVLLHAGGHSFPGARPEFFTELRNGLNWVEAQARH